MLYKIETEFKKYETIEDAHSILSDLKAQKEEITILNLSMNTYCPEVCKEICKLIKEMKNLKSIILESFFDSLNYEEMCECLGLFSDSFPRNLISLSLQSNALSCDFPEKFGIFLAECPLKKINLQDCGLGQGGFRRITKYLSERSDKSSLVSLNLSRNRVNVIDKNFPSLFNQFTNLVEFRINGNTIEENSLKEFLKNIKNEKLEVFSVSDNFIFGDSIEYLGKVFERNKMREFYLLDIKCDKGDIDSLLKIMNKKLVQNLPGAIDNKKPELILDISYNNVEQSAIILLEDLAEKYYIKKLLIYGNDYDDIENLKSINLADGGSVIDDEDEEESDNSQIDQELMAKFGFL